MHNAATTTTAATSNIEVMRGLASNRCRENLAALREMALEEAYEEAYREGVLANWGEPLTWLAPVETWVCFDGVYNLNRQTECLRWAFTGASHEDWCLQLDEDGTVHARPNRNGCTRIRFARFCTPQNPSLSIDEIDSAWEQGWAFLKALRAAPHEAWPTMIGKLTQTNPAVSTTR